MSMCSVDGCERTVTARGWCDMHYRRWKRDGSPGPGVPMKMRTGTLMERIANIGWDVNPDTGCWDWRGSTDTFGYGGVTFEGRRYRVPRAVLEDKVGQIGYLHTLHSCDRPVCCNPEHLSAGTPAENMRQMAERGRSGPRRRLTDTCRSGQHAWVAENMGVNSAGRNYCLACHVANQAAWHRRRKALRAADKQA